MVNKVNTFSRCGNTLYIMRDGWERAVKTTYRDDYAKEIKEHIWSLKSGYPYNASLGGGLHRYIMEKWYGQEVLDEMTKNGYVVDHINNIHTDCQITNLEFLKRNRNVAKGQYFDKESKLMRDELAISIFKDFKTKCYQITIGCNANIVMSDNLGRKYYIGALKLLYDCAYSLVILDAERILTQYDEKEQFSLENMNFCDKKIVEAMPIEISDDEPPMITKNGKVYLLLGTDKAYLDEVGFDEGWMPPSKK